MLVPKNATCTWKIPFGGELYRTSCGKSVSKELALSMNYVQMERCVHCKRLLKVNITNIPEYYR